MSVDTLFIGDLPATMEEAQLKTVFGAYGAISSSTLLPVGSHGNRAAIITYATADEAKWICENLNGNIPEGLEGPVRISFKESNKGKGKAWGKAKGEGWGKGDCWGGKGEGWGSWGGKGGSKSSAPETECENLFIGNLPANIDEETLKSVFGAYGTIKWCKLLEVSSLGFRGAIVEYSSLEEAKWIKENLNGNLPEGLTGTEAIMIKYKAYQEKAQGKASSGEGVSAVPYPAKGAGKEGGKSAKGGCPVKVLVDGLIQSGAMPGGVNFKNDESALYVKGLPWDTTDLVLFQIFSPFGAIAPRGAKAMLNEDQWTCKGYGFVNFLSAEEANVAAATLNGTQMPDGTILTVTVKAEHTGGSAANKVDAYGGAGAAKGDAWGKAAAGKGEGYAGAGKGDGFGGATAAAKGDGYGTSEADGFGASPAEAYVEPAPAGKGDWDGYGAAAQTDGWGDGATSKGDGYGKTSSKGWKGAW